MTKEIEIPEGYEARIEDNKVIIEPKESENERIRKALLEYFGEQCEMSDWNGIYGYEVYAWLEKQGEQDTDISSFPKEQQVLMRKYVSLDKITLIKLLAERDANNAEIIESFEKQGEQKPIDKVEPKFNVGDWVVASYGKVNQVVSVDKDSDGYTLDDGMYFSGSWCNKYHLWTIQDAKDGDVLANEEMIVIFKHFEEPSYRQHIVAYIGLDTSGNIQITDETWTLGIDKAKPATKEQREQLEKAITEAGYEWDDEKKELKKIEQSCYHNDGLYYAIDILEKTFGKVEGYQSDDGKMEHQIAIETVNALYHKKPAEWSEEDEMMLNHIICDIESLKEQVYCKTLCDEEITWLKSLKDRVLPQPKQEWSEADYNFIKELCGLLASISKDGYVGKYYTVDLVEKLKLLKPNHWKPSEEQMATFWDAICNLNQDNYKWINDMKSLYQDLKKLKG